MVPKFLAAIPMKERASCIIIFLITLWGKGQSYVWQISHEGAAIVCATSM
jgi:hypothetical protein